MFNEDGEFVGMEDLETVYLTCIDCGETIEGQDGEACPECGAEMEVNPSVLC